MDEKPTAPRVGALACLVLGLCVLAVGLYAVGAGHLYAGDTWPDFLAMFTAAFLVIAALVSLVGGDQDGVWSWARLRRPAWVGCALALALLVALSIIVPVETGVWVVGDSAHGFSLFTFLGALAVALTATAQAPRRAGVTRAGWDQFSGTADPRGAMRIRLRRYRLLSRASYVDVDRRGVTFVVPRFFGGGRRWFVPIQEIGVVFSQGTAPMGVGRYTSDDGTWVTRREFRTVYLALTSSWAEPNVTLLFTRPQELPPLRWSAGGDAGVPPSQTRGVDPYLVDGVDLRVVDPAAALEELFAAGAKPVENTDAFIERHRETVRDAEQARSATSQVRRVVLWTALSSIATLGLAIAFKVTEDFRYGVGVIVVLGATWLAQRRSGAAGDD